MHPRTKTKGGKAAKMPLLFACKCDNIVHKPFRRLFGN